MNDVDHIGRKLMNRDFEVAEVLAESVLGKFLNRRKESARFRKDCQAPQIIFGKFLLQEYYNHCVAPCCVSNHLSAPAAWHDPQSVALRHAAQFVTNHAAPRSNFCTTVQYKLYPSDDLQLLFLSAKSSVKCLKIESRNWCPLTKSTFRKPVYLRTLQNSQICPISTNECLSESSC